MDEVAIPDAEAAKNRLTKLVFDHLGIPKPGMAKHMGQLQDQLLPSFMLSARHAWLAAAPIAPKPSPEDMLYASLKNETQSLSEQIVELDYILEEIGVHDLLRDVAISHDTIILENIPVDPYEVRLLNAVAHPDPETAIRDALHLAATNPGHMASPSKTLKEAAEELRKANANIAILLEKSVGSRSGQRAAIAQRAPVPPPEKPKRRKLFTGLGKLLGGLVLLSGNALAVPSIAIGSFAGAGILVSVASGITAVGAGIGMLRREGE
jgi:hypothetical protein